MRFAFQPVKPAAWTCMAPGSTEVLPGTSGLRKRDSTSSRINSGEDFLAGFIRKSAHFGSGCAVCHLCLVDLVPDQNSMQDFEIYR